MRSAASQTAVVPSPAAASLSRQASARQGKLVWNAPATQTKLIEKQAKTAKARRRQALRRPIPAFFSVVSETGFFAGHFRACGQFHGQPAALAGPARVRAVPLLIAAERQREDGVSGHPLRP